MKLRMINNLDTNNNTACYFKAYTSFFETKIIDPYFISGKIFPVNTLPDKNLNL